MREILIIRENNQGFVGSLTRLNPIHYLSPLIRRIVLWRQPEESSGIMFELITASEIRHMLEFIVHVIAELTAVFYIGHQAAPLARKVRPFALICFVSAAVSFIISIVVDSPSL